MAILVKGQITITKGFDTWQKMVYEQDGKLEEHGIKFLFAGTERENPDQLHVVMMFPNMEAIQAFRDDDELTEKRREAGAVSHHDAPRESEPGRDDRVNSASRGSLDGSRPAGRFHYAGRLKSFRTTQDS